ncbi:MAG: TRAM domain-containing protein, partial [Actinobacteria bacterium]|nr:TRAM domain-containing protein [Actinomycetota bacterium]
MTIKSGEAPLAVGDVIEVVIGQIAHGGHFIAHAQGRTIFVRHAITGESAKIRITEVRSKMVRADAIEILAKSPDRVDAPCEFAGPGACGGCDFQHIAISRQRSLKQEVVQDAFRRHAGIDDVEVVVDSVPGDRDGLSWRTRVRWSVDSSGHLGFHRFRSSEILPVDTCLIATQGQGGVPDRTSPGVLEVRSAQGSDGELVVSTAASESTNSRRINQEVLGRNWNIDIESFWQGHVGAAEALVRAVLDLGNPQPSETWWDLYSGVGLFSGYLSSAVGPTGLVVAVEGSARSVRDARRNLQHDRQVKLVESDVGRWLALPTDHGQVTGVVLDPPRTGVGRTIAQQIAAKEPRVVVYVACDPVALARDVEIFASFGYRLNKIKGFDAFPMT